jgi:phosphomannomutase
MVARMPDFERVEPTRIGSPFVIAAMEAVLAADPAAPVVGFEANGGFLLGFEAAAPAGPLAPLMTRDSLLPMVTVLAVSRAEGIPVTDLVAALPPRRTASDRLQDVAPELSGPLLARLTADPAARAAFFAPAGRETGCDLTDGLRVSFDSGAIVHLRPSGNAPEFRIYAEADTESEAAALLQTFLGRVSDTLSGDGPPAP